MAQIKVIGHISNCFTCSGNVYDRDGISPTLCAGMGEGGNITPMIVSMRGRDLDKPTSRKKSNNFQQRLEIQQDGNLCGTLTTYQKDNMVLEPLLVGGLGDKKSNGGTQYYQQDRVYDANGIAMAHPAQIPEGSYKYMVEEKKTHQQDLVQSDEGVSRTLVAGSHGNADTYTKTMTNYRIRKLTPKECFRLMGVKDEDFEKLTVSNSQLYKQAGNSIVVDVLEAIFENMFINECKSNSLF